MTDHNAAHSIAAARRPGIAGAMFSAVATMLANARLARASHQHRSRGSPPESAHLRRDLGLPPYADEWWRQFDRW